MKKFLILGFVLFFAQLSFGQQIGIKGGINLASMNIEEFDTENRFGYHFGGYLNIPISDGFAIQPEVLYSARGVRTTYDEDFVLFELEGEGTLRLDYIDVPIMGVIFLGDFAQIEVGPYIGFLANSNFESEGDLGDFDEDIDSDNFKSMDFGLAGGLAINLGAFQIGARYVYGLQEVQDSEVSEALISDARHRVIQAYAAFRIGDTP
jgi:hypothetical protein